MNDGFNVIFAKRLGSPKSKFFETRSDVLDFILTNIDDIDFLSINDVSIDKDRFINDNKKISRYLKLRNIYEI